MKQEVKIMNTEILQQIYGSLSIFLAQTGEFLIKLIAAYIIWLIGKFLINSAVSLLEKADIKKWKIDDTIRNTLIDIGRPTAKVVLVLVILDFLGVGSSIIGALAQGISFTIAIALGLSFGEALKPEAKRIVEQIKQKTNLEKK
jgi:small-conductance mechanosensitive channel